MLLLYCCSTSAGSSLTILTCLLNACMKKSSSKISPNLLPQVGKGRKLHEWFLFVWDFKEIKKHLLLPFERFNYQWHLGSRSKHDAQCQIRPHCRKPLIIWFYKLAGHGIWCKKIIFSLQILS